MSLLSVTKLRVGMVRGRVLEAMSRERGIIYSIFFQFEWGRWHGGRWELRVCMCEVLEQPRYVGECTETLIRESARKRERAELR